MRFAIRWGAALLWLGAVGAGASIALRAQGAGSNAVPVVVELFTSEGCSDCPPADAVLTKLTAQSTPGVIVIALGEHVDYWDQQGWKDPFSSAAFTRRQVDYTAALRVESPYTPQMIVDGRNEFVGSNYAAAAQAVTKAARDRKLRVSIQLDPVSGTTLPLHVTVTAADAPPLRAAADVFVAVTEDNLSSHVERGENRGKDLRHTAVVRSLARIGGMEAKAPTWTAGGEVQIDRAWKPRALHVVAFVQEHASRAIVGAATATLN